MEAKQYEDYFFPKQLKRQLELILNYPLTIVEAPSGFGKSTAIKSYLEEIRNTTNTYWYTCLGEPAHKAWEGIGNLVSSIDETIIGKMKSIGFPCEETVYDLIKLVNEIHCEEQTVLVIDNYQLIRNEFLDMLSNAFARVCSHGLHIVIITQPPRKRFAVNTIYNPQKLLIDRSYFFFSKEDSNAFFKQSGIRLTIEELDHVWKSTEGWVAALCLQKKNYQVIGSFKDAVGIDDLLEITLWNRMTIEEQNFLLSLSLFDRFTLRQALVMLNLPEMPEYASELLSHCDFIRYDENSHSYYFHSILHDYLAKHMEQKKETAYGMQVFHRAGLAYAKEAQYYKAAQCYYEINEFELLLALSIKGTDMDEWVGLGSDIFVANIIKNCSNEVLIQYPPSLLVFAFEMLIQGKYELFEELCCLITQALSYNSNLTETEIKSLSGEFALMISLTRFNDIEQMSEEVQKAYNLLGCESNLFTFKDGWTMDAPSVLYLFWRESGELQQELKSLETCMPFYYKVTNHHGMGGEIVMRAEALFNAGDDIGAEVLCHKALYLANSKKQMSVCFSAELCLLKIAMMRGDTALYEAVTKSIDNRTVNGYALRSKYAQALINGFLCIELDTVEEIESWLLEPLDIERYLYSAAVPFGQMIYAGYLIATGQFTKLIGISELFVNRAEEQHLLIAKVYQLIYVSIAYLHTNQREKAIKQLKVALKLATPDYIYMPFVENAKLLGGILDSVHAAEYRNAIDIIVHIASRYEKGIQQMKAHLKSNDLGLTPREKEIAKLAQDGKTNKEIGSLLFVSTETVKMTLKKIFKKLDIQSRVQLKTAQLK